MSRAAQRNRRLAKLEAEAGLAGRTIRAMLEREHDRLQARSSAQLEAAIASGDPDQLEHWLAAHMAGTASAAVERLDAITRELDAMRTPEEVAEVERQARQLAAMSTAGLQAWLAERAMGASAADS